MNPPAKELSKPKFVCRICEQETRVDWSDFEKIKKAEKVNGEKALCCCCQYLEMLRRVAHSHNQSLRDVLHRFITGIAKEEGIEEEAVYKETK